MKKTILVLGFGILMVSLFCFGNDTSVSPAGNDGKERYKMFSPSVSSSGVPDVYVIDTQTGRIWKRTFFTDVKGIYFVPMPYLTADQLSASATPPEGQALESLSLQKQYDKELERARQNSGANKPATPGSP